MRHVKDFFKSIGNEKIKDTAHINNKENNSIGWRDNVVQFLGIIGVAVSIGFSGNIHAETNNFQAKYEREGAELVRDMYIQGMLSSKYKVKVVSLQEETVSKAIPGTKCEVNWGLNKNGLAQSLINGVNLDQSNLYRYAALYHETAHCEMTKLNNVFRDTGLSSYSESWINNWVVGSLAPNNPINDFYSESFADTYGMMMLLVKYDFSEDAVEEVNKWYEIRKIKREMDERQGVSFAADPHYTDLALKELINRIEELKRKPISEYKNIAMSIASHATMEYLNENRELQPLNEDSSRNKKRIRIMGESGSDLLIGGFENNNWFYESLIAQTQLIYAEKQGISKKSNRVSNSIARKMAMENINTGEPEKKVSYVGVVMANKGKSLNWNFKSFEEHQVYIKSFLSDVENFNLIGEWKLKNNWDSVKKDIKKVLSKKYSFSNYVSSNSIINIPTVKDISKKIEDKNTSQVKPLFSNDKANYSEPENINHKGNFFNKK